MMFLTKLICILLVFQNVYAEDSTGDPKLDEGLKAGLDLAQTIGDMNFQNMMGKLLTKLGPFLGAAGPIIDLIGSFMNQESAEMKYMRYMLAQIENRFDRIDSRFDEIAQQIDWSTTRTQLYDYERKLRFMKIKLDNIYGSKNRKAYATFKKSFLTAYETSYDESAKMLYDHIVDSSSLFADNILIAVMKGTNYDRRETQEFMVGLTKLIVLGVQIEMMYYKLKIPKSLESHKQEWMKRMRFMEQKMKDADKQIVKNYLNIAKMDSLKILQDNKGGKYENVADLIYKHLNKKYYWRNWLVVVYDDIKGSKKHYVTWCQGFVAWRNNGFNLFVASSSKTPSRSFSAAAADKVLNSANVRTFHAEQILKSLKKNLDCKNYSAIAVIDPLAKPAVKATPGRYRRKDPPKKGGFPFMLLLFKVLIIFG